MGGSISYFRQSSRPERWPKEEPHDQNTGLATSIIKFMRPKCPWVDDEKDKMQLHPKEQQQINETKERTLEEWFLASPVLNKNCMLSDGGEDYVFNIFSSPNVHVSSSLRGGKSDSNISTNSLEGLRKVDQVEQQKLICRSRSGKIKKRMSFRLPEEADIFIFYSPKEESVE